jgi:CRP-like cAMP-binding protein
MSEPTTQTEALQGIPFFAGLSREELDGVLDVARPVSFEAGTAIVTEGDPGDGMYVILSGTAEVDVGGRFHKLGPGNFFGEMALISAASGWRP